MHGPEIMARSISAGSIGDQYGNRWQYHSQSDRHSQIVCWAIMFDLLQNCPLLRQHASDGKIGFGINHVMQDFQTGQKKKLDLVVCTPRLVDATSSTPTTFSDKAATCGVILTAVEQSILDELPSVAVVPVGNVNLALEAKATMTSHVKALPRLHDELNSSHMTVHGDADAAIAAALVMINVSSEFLSTSRNRHPLTPASTNWNKHSQPNATQRTLDMVRGIRRRSSPGGHGFDAMGIVLIDFRNDGSPCRISVAPPAPTSSDSDHYANMIGRISTLYGSKFSSF